MELQDQGGPKTKKRKRIKVNKERLLYLAAKIEKLDPVKFSQDDWCGS
jgi:hypothetical protein